MDLPAPGQLSLKLMRGLKFRGKRVSLAPKESELELAICHFLRINRVFFWKQPNRGYFDPRLGRYKRDLNPYTVKGVPDLILIMAGHFVGWEIKTEKGRQSPDQKEFEERVKNAGAFYFVIRSVEEAETTLKLLDDYFRTIEKDE
jgi:hypothetical protein